MLVCFDHTAGIIINAGALREWQRVGEIRASQSSFLALKRIRLKSYRRLSGAMLKTSSITSPDASTHLRPALKNGVEGLNLR